MRLFLVIAAVLALAGCASTPPADQPSGETSSPFSPPAIMTVDRLDIRSQGLGTPVGLLPDDTMETPPVERPEELAWYKYSQMPGERGPMVIVGHVNGGGRPGVFVNLATMREGDQIDVTDANGRAFSYAVYKIVREPKVEFPTDAVYDNTDGPEIRLITCGGQFNEQTGSYLDNVIVFGRLVG